MEQKTEEGKYQYTVVSPEKHKFVIYEKRYAKRGGAGAIARVTLNMPEKLNALSIVGRQEDAADFYSALDEAAEDSDVKVVIVSGSGRAFSVGHDLRKVGFVYGMGTGQPGEEKPGQAIRLKMDRISTEDRMLKVFLHPKLTICQVHGLCMGGAGGMANLFDYITTAEDAQWGRTEQRLAFAGGGVPDIPILIAAVGLHKALDLLLTGRTISGKEAAEMGLATRAFPADKLEEETEKIAEAFCLLPYDAIAIGKSFRHMMYERLGLLSGFVHGYMGHTLSTQIHYKPGEFNFFKERRDKSAKAGFHGLHDLWKSLGF